MIQSRLNILSYICCIETLDFYVIDFTSKVTYPNYRLNVTVLFLTT